ncbi:plastocyanin/azurin family copper-binding protein [Streptomyces sp. c-19]
MSRAPPRSTSRSWAGEDYSFFCTFPGHISMMKGKVMVK